MIEKVLVLSATVYDFLDKDTGENRSGVTVFVSHFSSQENQSTIGAKPVKYSMPLEFKKFFEGEKLPAVAEMEWNFDFNRMKPMPISFGKYAPIEVEAYG